MDPSRSSFARHAWNKYLHLDRKKTLKLFNACCAAILVPLAGFFVRFILEALRFSWNACSASNQADTSAGTTNPVPRTSSDENNNISNPPYHPSRDAFSTNCCWVKPVASDSASRPMVWRRPAAGRLLAGLSADLVPWPDVGGGAVPTPCPIAHLPRPLGVGEEDPALSRFGAGELSVPTVCRLSPRGSLSESLPRGSRCLHSFRTRSSFERKVWTHQRLKADQV
mmetsp:Transcript_23864/g.68066  ORF Transcript_23864/g.68066 Transcript_23864/m.68066 type:complete len:225 (+) Transcript_23864:326-1000(+)